MTGGRRARGGFSLVEAMVCVALAGGVAAGLLAAQARAMANLAEARETLTCAELCASLAAQARAGLKGPGQGEFVAPKGYRWKITGGDEASGAFVVTYKVTVDGPSLDTKTSASAPVWIFRQSAAEGAQP